MSTEQALYIGQHAYAKSHDHCAIVDVRRASLTVIVQVFAAHKFHLIGVTSRYTALHE